MLDAPIHARAGRRALVLAHAIIRSFEPGTRIDIPSDADTSGGQARNVACKVMGLLVIAISGQDGDVAGLAGADHNELVHA